MAQGKQQQQGQQEHDTKMPEDDRASGHADTGRESGGNTANDPERASEADRKGGSR